MRCFVAVLWLCAWGVVGCGGESSTPEPDGGAAMDASAAVDGGRGAEGAGCEDNGGCAAGLYCQFKSPASECARPQGSTEGGWWCGRCTRPGAALQACSGGAPEEGEPCVEAAMKGYACRDRSCDLYTLRECVCSRGQWSCGFVSRSRVFPEYDAGLTPCGAPPLCWARCGTPP